MDAGGSYTTEDQTNSRTCLRHTKALQIIFQLLLSSVIHMVIKRLEIEDIVVYWSRYHARATHSTSTDGPDLFLFFFFFLLL
jgi:hypothetical protein